MGYGLRLFSIAALSFITYILRVHISTSVSNIQVKLINQQQFCNSGLLNLTSFCCLNQESDNNDKQQIVMSNDNCFHNCLKGCYDAQSESKRARTKRGLKCVTKQNKGKTEPTNSSFMIESSRYDQVPFRRHENEKQQLKNHRPIQQMQDMSDSHLRSSSIERERISYMRRHLQESFRLNQSFDNVDRRYSLDSNQRPHITFVPFLMLSDEKQKSITLSDKQNSGINTETTVPLAEGQSKTLQYGISIIKEEQQQKPSSFFQGAKGIVSKLRKIPKRPTLINELITESNHKKIAKKDPKTFFEQVRVCETRQAIVTHSSIESEEKKVSVEEISLDYIPMSPQTKIRGKQRHFNVGRLLGVGKWAHVYLCQDKQTNSLFALKQIYKQNFEIERKKDKFMNQLLQIEKIDHCNIMNIYSKFQTYDKLCLIVEYCKNTLFEQLKLVGSLPMDRVKKYASDLIKAIVYLHDNEIAHGGINIFNIFVNFGECKLKTSISDFTNQKQVKTFKKDIQGLAITIFEMAYGLMPFIVCIDTQYEQQKAYKKQATKQKILNFMNDRIDSNQDSIEYCRMNDFLKKLILWEDNYRLTSASCFSHLFLNEGSL